MAETAFRSNRGILCGTYAAIHSGICPRSLSANGRPLGWVRNRALLNQHEGFFIEYFVGNETRRGVSTKVNWVS